MEIIDAQVHIWEKEHPGRPYAASYNRTPRPGHRRLEEATADQMLLAMTACGVDAAVILTPALYGPDNSYSLEACARYPEKFALAGNIDPTAPDIDDVIRNWRSQPGALAVRLPIFRSEARKQWQAGLFDNALAAAERYDVPVATWAPALLRELEPTIKSYPDLQFILDHWGLPQPAPMVDRDPEPFQRLPDLLNLARYPNVAVKVSASVSLSQDSFPYNDLWPRIHSVIDAFGLDRVMWGSDWTRVLSVNTYAQDANAFLETDELSASDKEKLFGATLRKVMRWPKSG